MQGFMPRLWPVCGSWWADQATRLGGSFCIVTSILSITYCGIWERKVCDVYFANSGINNGRPTTFVITDSGRTTSSSCLPFLSSSWFSRWRSGLWRCLERYSGDGLRTDSDKLFGCMVPTCTSQNPIFSFTVIKVPVKVGNMVVAELLDAVNFRPTSTGNFSVDFFSAHLFRAVWPPKLGNLPKCQAFILSSALVANHHEDQTSPRSCSYFRPCTVGTQNDEHFFSGLSTHRWRTPAVLWKVRLLRHCSLTPKSAGCRVAIWNFRMADALSPGTRWLAQNYFQYVAKTWPCERCRPIASIHLLCHTFAYMILSRV